MRELAGMGGILDMKADGMLDPDVTDLLVQCFVEHFVPEEKALRIGGKLFPINSLVEKYYNLPSGRTKLQHEPRPGYSDVVYTRKSEFDIVGKTINDIWARITTKTEDMEDESKKGAFCVYFLSGLASIFLAPSSPTYIDSSFVRDLENHKTLNDLNWCDFVAEYLIAGIKEYLDNKRQGALWMSSPSACKLISKVTVFVL